MYKSHDFTNKMCEYCFKARIKLESRKLSVKFSFTPILKISWKNIENCKSLRLLTLSEDNFSKVANGDMGNLVIFGGIMAGWATAYLATVYPATVYPD